MQKIKEIPSERQAYNRLSARCAVAEKAPRDLEHKMREWGMERDAIERVMARLRQENFVNEERYARAFVRDKFEYAGWGRMKIRMALQQKRIAPSLIQQILDEVPDDEYEEKLSQLLQKKLKSTKACSRYELRGKLIGFATSRGFEQEQTLKVLNRLGEVGNSDEDD